LQGESMPTGDGDLTQQRKALPDSDDAEKRRDFDLRDHRALVKEKFERDGVDLDECIERQKQALAEIGLQPCEAGATNKNEKDEQMFNQCFYLALARSWIGDDARSMRETALSMKRVIEAAVLTEHPDWAGERVGEDVQAFSDFLFYVLGTNPLLSDLSVAVFDSVSGGVELYKGRCFPGPERAEEEQRANLLTILYTNGHYQALVPCERSKRLRPKLEELLQGLDAHNVPCVQTDV
ncbi:unnamed protein product, partial [Polarella glacialis]